MSMKEEYTAIDMSTAAADGFRDGQRAANGHSAQSIGMVGALVTALDGLLSITQDSTGVAGYHLNGNVAEWDEFPEVDTARDVLSLYRERADKPCFFGIDLAQGALDAGPWRDAIIDQGWTPPEQQQASDKVPCKTHPDAPHGFCRNSSHSEGRYVCECEHWEEPQASAAQSAPAGQREAFDKWFRAEQLIADHIDTTFISSAFLPYKAFQAGASWQRTQAAGVPDDAMVAVASAAYEREALAGATHEQAWHVALSEAIAAAPAQPAAQEGESK